VIAVKPVVDASGDRKTRGKSQFIILRIAGGLKIAMLWAETGLLPLCGLNLTSPFWRCQVFCF
jgi:hypothetical protein